MIYSGYILCLITDSIHIRSNYTHYNKSKLNYTRVIIYCYNLISLTKKKIAINKYWYTYN